MIWKVILIASPDVYNIRAVRVSFDYILDPLHHMIKCEILTCPLLYLVHFLSFGLQILHGSLYGQPQGIPAKKLRIFSLRFGPLLILVSSMAALMCC